MERILSNGEPHIAGLVLGGCSDHQIRMKPLRGQHAPCKRTVDTKRMPGKTDARVQMRVV